MKQNTFFVAFLAIGYFAIVQLQGAIKAPVKFDRGFYLFYKVMILF
jgi:hypothetical protein